MERSIPFYNPTCINSPTVRYLDFTSTLETFRNWLLWWPKRHSWQENVPPFDREAYSLETHIERWISLPHWLQFSAMSRGCAAIRPADLWLHAWLHKWLHTQAVCMASHCQLFLPQITHVDSYSLGPGCYYSGPRQGLHNPSGWRSKWR